MGISRYLYIIWDPGPVTWYLEPIGFDMVKRDPPFGTREFGTGYLRPNIWDGIFGTLQFGTRDPVPRVPLSAYAPISNGTKLVVTTKPLLFTILWAIH